MADLKKLDRRQRELVFKKIEKTVENQSLGKPLHAPLTHYYGERMEKFRLIYRINNTSVEFAWLEHRKHAYE
ncbi:TPA: type II toxin-antitoxin system RelE/ParE family toxin [Candidatus Micrarchaeota archaeon]|nr:MAG: hypothetical protein AUJ65_05570 [Candidatus Micrarchaeota archaeon CG1_02_51_15]HII38728.1 type II toxin-antitoxin system RelE/ParE family toxin [Candidatus Micrarchaeota archaeon]